MTAPLLLALLISAQAQPQTPPPLSQGGVAAPGGDASLSCDQLAAELMVAVGGVMGNAGEQIRIGQAQQPDMGGGVAGQVLGAAGGMLPNFVQGIVAAVEHQRQEQRAQEAQAGAMRQQVLMVEQEVRLGRLQRLHELHEQRCANRQSR